MSGVGGVGGGSSGGPSAGGASAGGASAGGASAGGASGSVGGNGGGGSDSGASASGGVGSSGGSGSGVGASGGVGASANGNSAAGASGNADSSSGPGTAASTGVDNANSDSANAQNAAAAAQGSSVGTGKTTGESIASEPTSVEAALGIGSLDAAVASSSKAPDNTGSLNPVASTGIAIDAYGRTAPTAPALGLTDQQVKATVPNAGPDNIANSTKAISKAYGLPARGLQNIPGNLVTDAQSRISNYTTPVGQIPDTHQVTDPNLAKNPAAWDDAARSANTARNGYMTDTRATLSDVGKQISSDMKSVGQPYADSRAKAEAQLGRTPGLTPAERSIAVSKGVISSAGRTNPTVTGIVNNIDRAAGALKAVAASRTVAVVGAAIDAVDVYQESKISRQTGDWSNTQRAASKVAGGWVGAAIAGATVGAVSGSVVPGAGNLVGLALGAAAGAVGYFAGSWFGGSAYDAATR